MKTGNTQMGMENAQFDLDKSTEEYNAIVVYSLWRFLLVVIESRNNEHPLDEGLGNQLPEVSIENFSFKPSILRVSVGTTVVWTNYDRADHNIKSNDFKSPM